MMAVFFFIAHEKGFKFHAQPQTGAYSSMSSNYTTANAVLHSRVTVSIN